jgi:outer membrane protein OmpA-like peptidoglycan-associated protein
MQIARQMAPIIVVALVLGACSGENDGQPTTTPPLPETTTSVVVTTSEPDGEVAATDTTPELVWRVEVDGRPAGLALDPNGDRLAVATDATYLYQLADGELVDAIVYTEVGVGYPEDIAYSSSGEYVVAGLHLNNSAITTVDGEIELVLPGGFNNRVAIAPDDTLLATSDRSGEIVAWELALSDDTANDRGNDSASNTTPSTVTITERWRLPAPEFENALPLDTSVLSLEFTPDTSLLAAVRWTGLAQLIDTEQGQVVSEFNVDGEATSAEGALLRFSPDGGFLAAAVVEGQTQRITVWDLEQLLATGDPIDAMNVVTEFDVLERVRDLHFSPDGQLLLVASRLGTTIWDPTNGELRFTFDEDFDATASQQPLAARFTPDGGHVVIARADGGIELWRLPGAEALIAPERPPCEAIPIPGDVLFDTGSAVLRPQADDVLEQLAIQLASIFDTAQLTFIGHTDSRGSAEANLELSLERATAVRNWFSQWASENGVDNWTLGIDGRGDTQLKVIDTAADGTFLSGAGQLNRRVDIEIAAPGC